VQAVAVPESEIGARYVKKITTDVARYLPQSDQANRYHKIAMEYFTKWPYTYAIPNRVASTVPEVLETNLFRRFGILRKLQSDQGHNFKSHPLQVLQRRGVKTRTTPLHQQSDGIVRWYNKLVEGTGTHENSSFRTLGTGIKDYPLPSCL
jgi:hypothetical protein